MGAAQIQLKERVSQSAEELRLSTFNAKAAIEAIAYQFPNSPYSISSYRLIRPKIDQVAKLTSVKILQLNTRPSMDDKIAIIPMEMKIPLKMSIWITWLLLPSIQAK